MYYILITYEHHVNWYPAIFIRRSRWQYNNHQLSEDTVHYLHTFFEKLNSTIKEIRVVFVNTRTENVFRGIIGSYGKIKVSPAYAAFMGDMTDPDVQEKIGYLGESFILEATYLSFSSCRVGGFFNHRVVNSHTWPEWVITCLNSVRLAPSAINRQPWRFTSKDDSITVSVNKLLPSIVVSSRLDLGIAMLHLEIGVYQKGVTGKWEYLKHPEVGRFWLDHI